MTRNRSPRRIVAPITAWDMEGYSSHVLDDQRQAQAALTEMDQRAAQAAGLPPLSKSSVQRAGDGAMMRWPEGTDPARLLADYPAKLVTELNAVNKRLAAEHRIRMRIAIWYGMSEEAAGGFAGPAPIAVARLLEAEPVKRALKDNPDAAVVLVIDSYLHKQFVLQHVSGLNPADFTPVRVSVKNFDETAWIAVLGGERGLRTAPAYQGQPREAKDSRTSGPIIAAVIGAVAAITAAIITASAYLTKTDGTNTPNPPTTTTSTTAPATTMTAASLSSGPPPTFVTFKEVGGNRRGVQTFSNTRGDVSDKPLIYFGDEVQVRCWAADNSGMGSVNSFYLIIGGVWDGLYAPANTFLNGAPPEDPGSTQIDPAVPPCG